MRASLSVAAGLCAISCNAVSVSVVTSGDTARMDAAGAEGKARRLPGAAVIHVTAIPPAGALTPIAGYITGLDNPADYQVSARLRCSDTAPFRHSLIVTDIDCLSPAGVHLSGEHGQRHSVVQWP